jgi:chloramphenicol 3-O phosphotransferase
MKRPHIIFLNGTSSSGKTTLALAFQRAMPEPTLYVSVDKFIFMSPDHVLKDDSVRPSVLLPLISAFHRSLPVIAQCGFPMIIDHVIERRDWMDEVAEALRDYSAYMVKVTCPLGELERRERERGDRKIGLAKWQLGLIHSFCGYDAEVDTSAMPVAANVEYLRELARSAVLPRALAEYRERQLTR